MFLIIIAIPLFAALGLGAISFNLFILNMTAPAILLGALSIGCAVLTAFIPKLCKG
jgi:hypothetical protein